MAARYCPSCGAAVTAGSETCGDCGHALTQRTPAASPGFSACADCASLIAADAQFCRSCGAPTGVAQERRELHAPAPEPRGGPSPPAPFAAFAPSAAAPEASQPPLVPRPSVPSGAPAGEPPDPSPEPPTGPGFVTYLPLPPATPPLDTSDLEESLPPAPGDHPPEVQAPEPAPAAAIQDTPPPAPPIPEPRPPRPKRPREPLSGGTIAAIVITAVLLVAGGIGALVLSGDKQPKPVAAVATETAPPTATRRPGAGLERQVQRLNVLMKTSQAGRAEAAKGDTKAAIANRAKLVEDVRRLRAGVTDTRLKAGLASFAAAIRESLRQNRECGAACPASALARVNRLKQQAVDALNPLLRRYAKATYRAQDI